MYGVERVSDRVLLVTGILFRVLIDTTQRNPFDKPLLTPGDHIVLVCLGAYVSVPHDWPGEVRCGPSVSLRNYNRNLAHNLPKILYPGLFTHVGDPNPCPTYRVQLFYRPMSCVDKSQRE